MRRRKNQTFQRYDLVVVAPDAPWIHGGGRVIAYETGAGEQAIVVGSYYDQYGGGPGERKTYTLLFKDYGPVSWYDEDVLTLVAPNRPDLFEEWDNEEYEDYD